MPSKQGEYIRAIAHAILIDIHVFIRRVTKWKMILLTRYKTMNENERIKENVQCDVCTKEKERFNDNLDLIIDVQLKNAYNRFAIW